MNLFVGQSSTCLQLDFFGNNIIPGVSLYAIIYRFNKLVHDFTDLKICQCTKSHAYQLTKSVDGGMVTSLRLPCLSLFRSI